MGSGVWIEGSNFIFINVLDQRKYSTCRELRFFENCGLPVIREH